MTSNTLRALTGPVHGIRKLDATLFDYKVVLRRAPMTSPTRAGVFWPVDEIAPSPVVRKASAGPGLDLGVHACEGEVYPPKFCQRHI